ncbi:MAG: hypothetical protein QOD98_3715 [Nocardioidaceae bacterium]|jgi:hypothetical protein|nr:hypothetical protein [Nocardioidaceae bacterium]
MSEVLILEFRDVDPALYDVVNTNLGLDPATGTGDWPDGMVSHTGAAHLDGNGLSVVEVWESRDAQDAFMSSRLGPALGQASVPEPTRAEWMLLKGSHVS